MPHIFWTTFYQNNLCESWTQAEMTSAVLLCEQVGKMTDAEFWASLETSALLILRELWVSRTQSHRTATVTATAADINFASWNKL